MPDLFNPTAEFTASDKLACAEREVKFRRRVYGIRVAEGKMKKAMAKREIACMEAIAADYRQQANREAGVAHG